MKTAPEAKKICRRKRLMRRTKQRVRPKLLQLLRPNARLQLLLRPNARLPLLLRPNARLPLLKQKAIAMRAQAEAKQISRAAKLNHGLHPVCLLLIL
jgi:hypothetical protein